MRKKLAIVFVAMIFVLFVLPMTVAAATNTELLAGLTEAINGQVTNGANTAKEITKVYVEFLCAQTTGSVCP